MDPLEGLDLSSISNIGSLGAPGFDVRDGVEEGEGDTVGKEETTKLVDKPEGSIEDPQETIVNSIGFKDEEGNELDHDGGILDEDNEGEEPSILSTFTDMGLIDLNEEELDSDEERDLEWFASKALQKVNKGIEEGVEEYKDSLPEAIKALLDDYEEGVPIGAMLQGEKEVFDVASISEEKLEGSESLQKRMIAELLTLQGESREDIEDRLTDYEDSGLLEKYAKRSQGKLVNFKAHQKQESIKAAKAQEIERRETYNTWLTDLKTDIDKRDEIIPGVILNDKQKKELYNGITKQDRNGKNAVAKYREANPDFDLQVAYLATVLKGDFSALEAAANTKATKKLKNQASSGGGSSISKKRSSLKGVDLNIMKKFA
jgi:hypothetical protein